MNKPKTSKLLSVFAGKLSVYIFTAALVIIALIFLLTIDRLHTPGSDSLDAGTETQSKEVVYETSNLYRTYEWLDQRLSEPGWDIDERVLDALELVMINDDELVRAKRIAVKAIDDEDYKDDLYAVLIESKPSDDLLYSYLKTTINELLGRADKSDTNRGANYAWNGGDLLDTILTAYEETQQKRFLDLARNSMSEMLSNRDDVLGRKDEKRDRILKSWGTDHLEDGDEYYNVVTHAGRIASMMARYAWIVEQNSSIDQKNQQAANRFLQAAEDSLREFDDEFTVSDKGDYGYYWRTSEDNVEPLNHQTSVGLAYLFVSELNDSPYWRTRLEQITEFTKQVMYEDQNDNVVWQYVSNPDDPQGSRPEPIWKGQVTIRFMIYSEELDAGFSETELVEVAKSVRQNVIRDGKDFNSIISSKYEPLYDYVDHRHGGLKNLVPYLVLGPYDSELKFELVDIISSVPEVGGWFSNPKTSIAYAYRL